MLKNKPVRIIISLIVLLVLVFQANGQSGLSTPYSAFGIGYPNYTNNTRNMAMGGIGIGTRDFFTVNTKNPASYTAIDTTSFIFEGAAVGHYLGLKTDSYDEAGSDAALSHLLFGFPITKWWKSSVGLLPFSTVGYNVNSLIYKENIGNTLYAYVGSGGLSRVYWGNAIQLFKNFSVGVNASYLFGTTDRSQNISFPDSAFRINTKINNQITVGDIYFDFGVQYFTDLKNNLKLTVGADLQSKIKSCCRKKLLCGE